MNGLLQKFLRFNWILFASMMILIVIGTIAIWSAGNARTEVVFHNMWKANLFSAFLGLVLYFAVAFTDYRKLFGYIAWPAYGIALAMLVLVLIVGSERFGGKRWLWFFQPSEISKLCVIAIVAVVYGAASKALTGFRGFCLAAALIAPPLLLILAEPDLGTALTLVPACTLMLFAARVWRSGLLAILITGAAVTLALLGAVGEAERPGVSEERREMILRYVPLKDHQIKRVKVFLFPDQDISGAGYNYRQALLSIASGGLRGKGLRKGESNHLKYLPQVISMNDFIFCVWAEETGYIGSLTLISLFGMLVISGAWVALRAVEGCGRLLALGVSSLIFAHVFINIAMSIGIVPITGLPLPFISAGRTFLITVMLSLGAVQSVAVHSNLERAVQKGSQE